MKLGGWTALAVGALAALTSGGWLWHVGAPGAAAQERFIDVAMELPQDLQAGVLGRRFGALRLGAVVELTSNSDEFGGLSSLSMHQKAPWKWRLGAVSDTGRLLEAEVMLRRGFSGWRSPMSVRLAPLRDADGAALAGKRDGDSEGHAPWTLRAGEDAVSCAFISFERRHRVSLFCPDDTNAETAGGDGFSDATTFVFGAPIEAGDRLIDNQGLEGLTAYGPGLLLAAGELPSLNGAHPVWALRPPTVLQAGDSAWPGVEAPAFGVANPGVGYGLTALEEGPGGVLVMLFRKWVPGVGNSAVIAFASGRDIAMALAAGPGDGDFTHPVITPRELLRLTPEGPLPVDNFEGIAVSDGPGSDPLVWMVSDDNFRGSQRTLLYAFQWER